MKIQVPELGGEIDDALFGAGSREYRAGDRVPTYERLDLPDIVLNPQFNKYMLAQEAVYNDRCVRLSELPAADRESKAIEVLDANLKRIAASEVVLHGHLSYRDFCDKTLTWTKTPENLVAIGGYDIKALARGDDPLVPRAFKVVMEYAEHGPDAKVTREPLKQ